MATLKIDFVTDDPSTNEFVLYLVEVGPWAEELVGRLRGLEERIYLAIDAVLDGRIASSFPDSRRRPIRIQVDAHDAPEAVDALVRKLDHVVNSHPDYLRNVGSDGPVARLRLVTGRAMGRDI